jgi:hypothetical protein
VVISGLFPAVAPTAAERAAARPGDEFVPRPDVVMDRAFSVPAPPPAVWPWIVQLGKERAGWYLPGWAERWVPAARRGLRAVDPGLQVLRPGDVIPYLCVRHATFHVAVLDAPQALVHRSARGAVQLSWAITLAPEGSAGTRLHLRLRLGGVRRRWLAATGGELADALTVAGLAAGLRERVRPPGAGPGPGPRRRRRGAAGPPRP